MENTMSIEQTQTKRPLDEVSNSHENQGDQDRPIRPAKIHRGSRRGASLLAAAGIQPPILKHQPSEKTSPSKQANKNNTSKTRTTTTTDPLLSQPLPPHLHALKDIFIALQIVYEMMRKRGKRTTYDNLRSAVEEASSKRFTVSHLYQLHHLLPDSITLEYINLPINNRNTTSSTKGGLSSYAAASTTIKTEQQLLVTLPSSSVELPGALRQQLHRALVHHVLSSYLVYLQQLIDDAIDKKNDSDDGVVDELRQELALVMKRCNSSSSNTNDNDDTTTDTTTSDNKIIQFRKPYPEAAPDVPINTTTLPPPSSTHSNTTHTINRNKSLAGASFTTNTTTQEEKKDATSLLDTMPEELRSRTASGIVSLEALRMLESNERVHERLSSQSARSMRTVNAALRALPKTFGTLRRIFGLRGPSAMKLQEVVKRMKEGGAETLGEEEIKANIECLAKHAPEFIELKAWGSCGTMAVWIQRKCDVGSVVAKLKTVAASIDDQR